MSRPARHFDFKRLFIAAGVDVPGHIDMAWIGYQRDADVDHSQIILGRSSEVRAELSCERGGAAVKVAHGAAKLEAAANAKQKYKNVLCANIG
eukprot:2284293-Pyramimonas_sp.AAC.1